jgi:CMP-N,N'-diacetyllegionaminic acid synthase
MKTIALIPARGGSKGIPGKNTYPILGKPLIQYSIEVALECKLIDELWVSSDSEGILDVAKKFSNVRIHKRPNALATDTSSINETIAEIFNVANYCDALILLQPTSPIRDLINLEEAISIFTQNLSANSLISVSRMDDIHPARMYWKQGLDLQPIMKEFEGTRRQDIPPAYYRNGSIYIVRRDAFFLTNSVMAKPSIGYEMPNTHLLNIDEPRDLLIAEPLIKNWLDNFKIY